ncbi:MAG: glycyl-radical enzyme activating protein [Bacteriovoracaceae bacterium]|jgi:pyruvate formate lyase activating enzyme|nr:glycyl-radical enzyme activating protein [Bacteriovoracaceae bacterium]
MSRTLANIFDIQRFSIHDGQGIRTTVFFKGCSLNCQWCQNPESKAPKSQLYFDQAKCQDCKSCIGSCPSGAISNGAGKSDVDFNMCNDCGQCVESCPNLAFELLGKSYTEDELLDSCLKDQSFYESSGGGVTLSGGEAVLQSEFLQGFLPKLKEAGVHILLETAGNYPFRLLSPLLPYISHIYIDMKFYSEDKHLKYTGSSNQLILENLGKLVEMDFPLTVRVPGINGINTDIDENEKIASHLNSLGISEVELLKYNSLWESKISRIDTAQKQLNISNNEDYLHELKKCYSKYDIRA